MARHHLRPVETPHRVYVVARTQLVEPGRPYVVAECAGPAFASASREIEHLSRPQMLADPRLAEALQRWEASDDSVLERDTLARRRLARDLSAGPPARPSPTRAAAQAMHPSRLGKRWLAAAPAPTAPEGG